METAFPVRVEVPSPRVEFRYAGLTRRLGWSAVALLVGACVLSPVTMNLRGILPFPPFILGVAAPPLLLLAALGAYLFRPKRAGTVGASDEELVITAGAEQQRLPRSEIESGGFEQHPDRTLLRLRRRGGNEVHITLGTAAEAEALLRALGLGTQSRLRRVRLESWATRLSVCTVWAVLATCASTTVASLVVGLTNPGPLASSVLYWLAFAFTPIVVFLSASAPRLRIGADGITIEHITGNRFVPYADLCAVTLVNRAIVLTLRDEPSLSIPSGLPHERLAAICEQIETARTANQTALEPALLGLLAREGRPLAAWRTALQGLVGGGTYRQLPVEPAALTELLEHPHATPEQRIAAALALTESRTVGARGRVRGAAQSTADTRVRVALETVAQGEFDEAKIERALRRRRE